MHWLFLLLSLGAMAVALRTASMALMALSLLAALGLLIAWAMGWYRAKAGHRDRNGRGMVDPVELHRLREQARARKTAEQAQASAMPQQPRDEA